MNFEQVYREFFKIIYSYIITRVREDNTAKDIAALTWQKVLKNFDAFDENKGNMSQWLFTIARNEITMYYRMYYVKKVLSLTGFEDAFVADEKGIEETLIDNQEKQLLLQAMATLNKKEQDIIALKFYSGLNNRQIAELVNLSESNVGTIINRGMNKIRVFLEVK
ncbi:MAG: sigma-70 family RNA polymerase sigma factor [Endomicrobia bacterium]|nr:sigma-70 family RNA polymerase sigma factor [Endomicrobiia bacterium]MCL2507193.1 sigma-70 family RNA polymerase sigma factor [Endomicrobiia bacterium]